MRKVKFPCSSYFVATGETRLCDDETPLRSPDNFRRCARFYDSPDAYRRARHACVRRYTTHASISRRYAVSSVRSIGGPTRISPHGAVEIRRALRPGAEPPSLMKLHAPHEKSSLIVSESSLRGPERKTKVAPIGLSRRRRSDAASRANRLYAARLFSLPSGGCAP